MKPKVFAAYLPQFHETEENNLFWGKGFTDWIGVKKAVPQFDGHIQPNEPLGDYYYDLSEPDTIRWQARLAREYGIDGFCIYHYWFQGGRAVLDTPLRLINENKDIDISYFLSWDNSSWKRSWSNIEGNAWAPQYDPKFDKGTEVLLRHDYGNEKDWTNHFYWLLPFFQDNRYYRIEGKPVFILFSIDDVETIKKMQKKWNELALKHGMPGIYMISRVGAFRNRRMLDAQFKYEPIGTWDKKKALTRKIGRILGISGFSEYLHIVSYEKTWKKIIRQSRKLLKQNVIMSGFVRYDDTPRRGDKATIVYGDSPRLFKRYFKEFYSLNCKYKMPFILLTAWNEWGEGAFLEPDKKNGYAYLESIKEIVKEYGEHTAHI